MGELAYRGVCVPGTGKVTANKPKPVPILWGFSLYKGLILNSTCDWLILTAWDQFAMSAVGRRDSSHECIYISNLAKTKKCSSSQQLFSPVCGLWIQKVGKIAKGPALKLVGDVRADMGGVRCKALSLQGLLHPHLRQGLPC